MSVRAKMKCVSIAPCEWDSEAGSTIRLEPVIDGSDENKSFYRYTPGGQVVLSTVNKAAADQFVQGKEYYVDFTAAE